MTRLLTGLAMLALILFGVWLWWNLPGWIGEGARERAKAVEPEGADRALRQQAKDRERIEAIRRKSAPTLNELNRAVKGE